MREQDVERIAAEVLAALREGAPAGADRSGYLLPVRLGGQQPIMAQTADGTVFRSGGAGIPPGVFHRFTPSA
ncbi:MAG: hypothetical protein ACLSHC_17100 [Bilophila wadsworthia]